jgi:hypothetical protein
MQQQSPTRAPHAPVILDPEAHVSRHIARRVRQLIEQRQVRPWSVNGIDLRQYRAYVEAGVKLPTPTLMRGTVGAHRVELSTDDYGRALARCDCTAASYGLRCAHVIAFAVVAVTLGWRAA